MTAEKWDSLTWREFVALYQVSGSLVPCLQGSPVKWFNDECSEYCSQRQYETKITINCFEHFYFDDDKLLFIRIWLAFQRRLPISAVEYCMRTVWSRSYCVMFDVKVNVFHSLYWNLVFVLMHLWLTWWWYVLPVCLVCRVIKYRQICKLYDNGLINPVYMKWDRLLKGAILHTFS